MLRCSDDIMIFRYIQRSIKQSSHATIIDLINRYNFNDYFKITNNSITCLLTGAKINYSGLYGQEMNIRSLSPSYKIILIEEAANVTGELFDILLPTVLRFDRVLVIAIYNITTTTNPAYIRFFKDKSPETYHIFGTMFDNKYISKKMLERAEKDKEIMSIDEWNMHYKGIPQETLKNAIFSKEALSKLQDTDITPTSFDTIIISLDPAVKSTISKFDEDQKVNYSGIAVLGLVNGIVYGLEFHQVIESPDNVIDRCINLYRIYKADYILYEENNGADYIKSLILSKDNTVIVKAYRSTVDKMKRASMIVMSVITDRVKIVSKTTDTRALIHELQRCTSLGYLKEFQADSPNLTDSLTGGVIDLLRLNQRQSINTILQPTITNPQGRYEYNIILSKLTGNTVASIECKITSINSNYYVTVLSYKQDSNTTFTIDKEYTYGYVHSKNINGLSNVRNIKILKDISTVNDNLKYVRSVEIQDSNLLDEWNEYSGENDTDGLLLLFHLFYLLRRYK